MSAFIILAILIAAMAIISCLPGGESLYGSTLFTAGWGILALTSLWVMLRRRLWRRPSLFLLHMAFLVILAGALATHLWGTSQLLHLRVGDTDFAGKLPVTLVDFRVEYYPGTQAPADFISTLEIDGSPATVAMNRVASARGYRFYQTSYDSDCLGSVLTVTHDPVGIAVTYVGYLLLLAGLLLTIVRRWRRPSAAALSLLMLFGAANASAAPKALPADVAARFCSLAAGNPDGRVTPLSTLARQFTRSVTGGDTYQGLTPEQVMTGWLFCYDSWRREPCLKIKDTASRAALGIDGKMASMTDFFDAIGNYRLDGGGHSAANAQFSLASQAAAGSLWRLFPCKSPDGATVWFSPVDDLPDTLSTEQWSVTRHSLNYMAELAAAERWDDLTAAIDKLSRYQLRAAPEALPGPARIAAERWLTGAGPSMAAPALLLGGVLLFLFPRRRAALLLALAGALWTASLLAAAAIATGRMPMANGPETMLWLALLALTASIVARRRQPLMLPLGSIVGSLALLVAAMGLRTPQLGPLMPVLRSPLLSIHVACVMTAYALLALIALCCVGWMCGRRQLIFAARRMLFPAVALLAAGIFIGAVWANVSWGRYWGWDPKEVWALITMLVYSAPLHPAILPFLRSDRGFARWCSLAFISVLVTYFGVNFLLGGLHSYA